MWHSNVQTVVLDKGRGARVANSRETHATKREAYNRVRTALTVAGKPKNTVYKFGRQYTVAL